MAKGKLLYRKEVTIKGYPGTFHKECRFSLKDGFFSINYPEKVLKDNLTKVAEVYAKSLDEVEAKWTEVVIFFEAMSYNYKTVILYQIETSGSYKDGSGQGFVFNWGVYRKVDREVSSYRWAEKYLFERNYGKKNNNYAVRGSSEKDWKEMEWSQDREDFFLAISKQVENITQRLEYFVKNIDVLKLDNLKLIG